MVESKDWATNSKYIENIEDFRSLAAQGEIDGYKALVADLEVDIEARMIEEVLVDEYLSPGCVVHPRALVFLVSRVRTVSKGFHDRFAERAFGGNLRIEAYDRICEQLEAGDRRSAHDRFMEHISGYICSECALDHSDRTPEDVARIAVSELVLHEASEMAYFAALEDRADFFEFFVSQRYAAGKSGAIEAMVLRKAKDRGYYLSYKMVGLLAGKQAGGQEKWMDINSGGFAHEH